jgi:hypothetical protein
MPLQQRFSIWILALMMCVGVGSATIAAQLTTPPESLNGLRPGNLTIDQLTTKYGKPDVTKTGGLLGLYGGSKDSLLYGWFLTPNPQYTVPDLAVETATGSDQVELVMSIGYDGLKTQKGVACFQTEAEVLKAYGKPDFAYSIPMHGFVLRELYYVNQGISFDLAPTGPSADRQVVAIYVTYPEYLQRAINIRKALIDRGTGTDVTGVYTGALSV